METEISEEKALKVLKDGYKKAEKILEDAAVVAVCWKLVGSDVQDYIEWRKK